MGKCKWLQGICICVPHSAGLHTEFGARGQIELPKILGGGGGGQCNMGGTIYVGVQRLGGIVGSNAMCVCVGGVFYSR